MCGIIAYSGGGRAARILLDGLSRLEYRGYDSAGIAVINSEGEPEIRKSVGKLSTLLAKLGNKLPSGKSGVGHTRWATHGEPTDANAHPHTDCDNKIVVSHNGIVENFLDLKRDLKSNGHIFDSETDSECIAHLIEQALSEGKSFEEAVRATAVQLRGAHAVVAAYGNEPGKIIGFRLGNAGGIVVGYGQGEMFLASDLPALLPHTQSVAYLSSGELSTITENGVSYKKLNGEFVDKKQIQVQHDDVSAVKGEYKHFMLKEINEQPESVINTLRGRVSFDPPRVCLEGFPFSDREIRDINRVVLIGMGTSLHAAVVGRNWIESLAKLPAEADSSSEFRHRDVVIDEQTLVISICQSGETADTLAAMEVASAKGARQVTLCNYEGTQTTRISHGTVLIRAGLEIGVAASKTFLSSLTALYLITLYMAEKRGVIEQERLHELIRELVRLPNLIGGLLENDSQYERLGRRYAGNTNFLYLGRGINYPMAMEGALKLKEISYIHAEGYPAGEMKHGPISLIDEHMPVVALVPNDALYEKMYSNVREVLSRGGRVIAIVTEGDKAVSEIAHDVVCLPRTSTMLTPMLMAVPLQLIAYHTAVQLGCDVDKPRNLAKSVTVE